NATCGQTAAAPDANAALTAQVACDSEFFGPCPAGTPVTNYPRRTAIVMHPLPAQTTMPDPCAGVPANPWCSSGGISGLPSAKRCVDTRGFSFTLHHNAHG